MTFWTLHLQAEFESYYQDMGSAEELRELRLILFNYASLK